MSSNINVKARLQEARAAYHSLLTGTMARVVVDQNGERVEFTAARKSDLYAYIQELQSQVPCDSSLVQNLSSPAGFLF